MRTGRLPSGRPAPAPMRLDTATSERPRFTARPRSASPDDDHHPARPGHTRPPRRPRPGPPAAPSPVRLPRAGELARGHARGAPLRREGPAKLTGTALYADDLVFPGAWYGATLRSTEPHARLLGIERDADFDWSRVVVVTAEDIPGDNVVSLITDDQPVLVPVGGGSRHQAGPGALPAAPRRAP